LSLPIIQTDAVTTTATKARTRYHLWFHPCSIPCERRWESKWMIFNGRILYSAFSVARRFHTRFRWILTFPKGEVVSITYTLVDSSIPFSDYPLVRTVIVSEEAVMRSDSLRRNRRLENLKTLSLLSRRTKAQTHRKWIMLLSRYCLNARLP
jgi:hypothetical protein